MSLVLTLTEHYKHRKHEEKIKFEEDIASQSVDFIGTRWIRSLVDMFRRNSVDQKLNLVLHH